MFNGFFFPQLSSLKYSLDGPDKTAPDQFFIEDREKRFLLSFDTEMKNFALVVRNKADYDIVEIVHGHKSFRICYPCQRKRKDLSMGYFRIRLRDSTGKMHNCFGQLSIAPPMRYTEGLKEYKEIWMIFDGLSVREETAARQFSKEEEE